MPRPAEAEGLVLRLRTPRLLQVPRHRATTSLRPQVVWYGAAPALGVPGTPRRRVYRPLDERPHLMNSASPNQGADLGLGHPHFRRNIERILVRVPIHVLRGGALCASCGS